MHYKTKRRTALAVSLFLMAPVLWVDSQAGRVVLVVAILLAWLVTVRILRSTERPTSPTHSHQTDAMRLRSPRRGMSWREVTMLTIGGVSALILVDVILDDTAELVLSVVVAAGYFVAIRAFANRPPLDPG